MLKCFKVLAFKIVVLDLLKGLKIVSFKKENNWM